MDSQTAVNSISKRRAYSSDLYGQTNANHPLRVGLWHEGEFSWEYPKKNLDNIPTRPLLSLLSIHHTSDYEILKMRLSTKNNAKQKVKIIVQDTVYGLKCNTSFYSPNEKAIMRYTVGGVTMMGGSISGRDMAQYCVLNQEGLNTLKLKESLQQGSLPLAWIAKEEICSIYILESEITNIESEEIIIWSFHGHTENQVSNLKNNILSKYV